MTPIDRAPTDIDRIADAHLDRLFELDPTFAVEMGRPGRHDSFGDLSPAGAAALADAAETTLGAVSSAAIADDVDAVTADALKERLGLTLERYRAGQIGTDLNVIASPVQGLREVFDQAPTATVEDWEDNAARLADLPRAMDGYLESLRAARDAGRVPASLQVREGIRQAEELTGPGSFFRTYAAGAAAGDRALPAALSERLSGAAEAARGAYGRLAEVLREEFAPIARERDGVGREEYALHSRDFLGTAVDLDETYAWGLEELATVRAEQEAIAERIAPGAGVAGAMSALDADPARRLRGTGALRDWMQSVAEEAIGDLGRSHFDIPEPVRRIEAMIAPTQSGGIYYTPPSEDFARPGRMWWAVPAGETEFSTWRERTTVYHEGAPGHHLQCGIAMTSPLNSWRRHGVWVPGTGEGWALYAERLMADLGYLEDPGDRLGMLDAQRLRAARVVLDIGAHVGFPAPEEFGGGEWNEEKAFSFLGSHASLSAGVLRFEVRRYLGWPGQAPSYKIGQRLWEGIRDAAVAEGTSLRDFHSRALGLGSLGLDTMTRALAATAPRVASVAPGS